jgi:hypothetical protein
MSRALLLLALVVLQAASLGWPAAAQGALIEYRDGRLSADAQGVQAEAVFVELEKQAGVRVQASKEVRAKSMSVSFRALELENGMRQIVRSLGIPGYAVLYDPKAAKPTYVLMESTTAAPSLGKPSAPIAAAAATPSAAPTPRQLDKEELLELAKQRREARIRSDPAIQRKLAAKRAERDERKRANEERKKERAAQKLERDAQKELEREARRAAMREAAGADPAGGVGGETIERPRR